MLCQYSVSEMTNNKIDSNQNTQAYSIHQLSVSMRSVIFTGRQLMRLPVIVPIQRVHSEKRSALETLRKHAYSNILKS